MDRGKRIKSLKQGLHHLFETLEKEERRNMPMSEKLKSAWSGAVEWTFDHVVEPFQEYAYETRDFYGDEPSSLRGKVAVTAVNAVEVGTTVTVLTGMYGYAMVRAACYSLAANYRYATQNLESFEPAPMASPHWQDIMFGEGRAEKLVARFEGLPTVKDYIQKNMLAGSEGGLRVLPGHRDLVKYALNDKEVADMVWNIGRRIDNVLTHQLDETANPKDFAVNLNKEGNVSLRAETDDGPVTVEIDREQMVASLLLGTQIHNCYKENKTGDHVAMALKIAGAIYDWAREDVLPVAPGVMQGFDVEAQEGGGFALRAHKWHDPLAKAKLGIREEPIKETLSNEEFWRRVRIDMFRDMARGYKGKLSVDVPAAQPKAPAGSPAPQ